MIKVFINNKIILVLKTFHLLGTLILPFLNTLHTMHVWWDKSSFELALKNTLRFGVLLFIAYFFLELFEIKSCFMLEECDISSTDEIRKKKKCMYYQR